MRDIEGKILIPGFYDDVRPLTAIEKRALAQTPAVEEQLKQELAIAAPEGGGAPLRRANPEARVERPWYSSRPRGCAGGKRHRHGSGSVRRLSPGTKSDSGQGPRESGTSY